MPIRFFLPLALAWLAGSAWAQASTQAVVVQAAVMARTSVQVQGAPASIEVSERDIQRGFVEAPHPVTLAVHSNVSSGVALHFHCAGEIALQAVVEGEGVGMPLLLAWQRQPRQVQLKIRFLLSPQARAGSYPWPLRVSAAT